MVWLFLLFLGLTLYYIVQHSVVRVTQTPWWLLWLVLMIPAFLIAGWTLAYGDTQSMPTTLLVGGFLVSLVLYLFLISANPRIEPPAHTADPDKQPENTAQATKPETTPTLNPGEQNQLQQCFPWTVYYLQHIDYRPQAVICRGQLRTAPDAAYQTIRQNIQAAFGDRFLVIFQTGALNQPFFALVANPYASSAQKPAALYRPDLALGLVILTLITTTLAGLNLVDANVDAAALLENPALLLQGLPYAIALMTILGIHELGHFLTAQRYQIRTTLPYFIPLPFAFGTFGAYIQMRSPSPTRKALFDVGIAGPLAGFIVTLPILIWGLMQSELVPLPEQPNLISTSAFNPKFSLGFTLIARLIFGGTLSLESAINLHPVAVAGWLGLIVTALNLMPVGQLDGGHIVHAMYGQRVGIIVGQISRLLVLLLAFVQPFLLFWGILLLFMPVADEPALNDVSELDNWRDGLGLLALALLVVIILPVPNGLETILFSVNPAP